MAKNTIKISNIVGISLVALKNLELLELLLFLKFFKHDPKYKW